MTTPDWEARGRNWWSHVRVLADDGMEGRETGSPGIHRAADYVIEQFRLAGLQPAGVDGYRQPVDFAVNQLDEPASSLTLTHDGKEEPLKLRDAAQFNVTTQTVSDLDAEAAFVGYGLEIPELDYSDFAGLDLHGKIAVYFRGGPSDVPGPIKAHYQSAVERLRALRKAGAVGMLMMLNPRIPDLPWPRWASGLLFPRMELSDVDPSDPRPLPLSGIFNPEHLSTLFAGSGHSAQDVMSGLGGPGPLPRFPLAMRLRAHVEVRRAKARCHNVVGVLPGSDPALRNEYVVGSAHLDHLGIGEPINSDSIYSGAMDNASGVATLIEVARAMKASQARPKRSILFVVVTGEEKGLLGSDYFAKHPSVSGRIVADLNVDMFLPLYPFKHLEVQGIGESTLGPTVRAIAQEVGVEPHAEYIPDQVLFIRSDQYSFVKKGAPSVHLGIGYDRGSESEEATFRAWFRDRYHAPADDVDQPVDLVTAARFTDLVGRAMTRVANDPTPPSWNSDSFFRKLAR